MSDIKLDHRIAKLLHTDCTYLMDGKRYPDDPHYSSNLNVIHSVCQEQIRKHGTTWMVKYNNILCRLLGNHDHVEHEAIHASAQLRAEAFVEAWK